MRTFLPSRIWPFLFFLLAGAALVYTVWYPFHTAKSSLQTSFLGISPHWADSVYSTLTQKQRIALLTWVETAEPLDAAGCLTEQLAGGILCESPYPPAPAEVQVLRQQASKPIFVAWALPDSVFWSGNAWLPIRDTACLELHGRTLAHAARLSGTELLLLPHFLDQAFRASKRERAEAFTYSIGPIQQQRILAVADPVGAYLPALQDTILRDSLLAPFKTLAQAGVSGFVLKPDVIRELPPATRNMQQVRSFWVKNLRFHGLCIARARRDSAASEAYWWKCLRSGADAVAVHPDEADLFHHFVARMLAKGLFSEIELKARCERLLMAKRWAATDVPEPALAWKANEIYRRLDALETLRQKAATFIAYDSLNLLPVAQPGITLIARREEAAAFIRRCAWYGPVNVLALPQAQNNGLAPLPPLDRYREAVLLLPHRWRERPGAPAFEESLKLATSQTRLTIAYAGPAEDLINLPAAAALLCVPAYNEQGQDLLAQALFGGFSITGRSYIPLGAQPPSQTLLRPASRLGWSSPEELGLSASSLYGIDRIAAEAIDNLILPGCQVLVAWRGQVIYQKSFGYHTYLPHQPVRDADLYDLASVTKVAATTLAAMKLVDEGKLPLLAPLGVFFPGNKARFLKDRPLPLPDTLVAYDSLPLRTDTTKRVKQFSFFEITPHDLLTHHSGLPAGLRILPYINYRRLDTGKAIAYFHPQKTERHTLPVAANLFFLQAERDSLMQKTFATRPDPFKSYLYSDMNMVVMKWVIDSLINQPFDQYLNERFYRPLGLQTMGYLPLDRFDKSRIPPTEFDQAWRRQLVQGYVHDPTAALLGGVSGNAGLFSNAYDLAVIFQMWINGGYYGGKRYLSERVVRQFTIRRAGHRGLGFDMSTPGEDYLTGNLASAATYGHSGFTGIGAWNDPERDLVFIFLSNRVHPRAIPNKLQEARVRQRMHDVAIQAILQALSQGSP